MSDDWEPDDNNPDSTSGGKLRALYEQQLAENKVLKQELADQKTLDSERVASEILKGKGYAPAVARLAVKDGVDVGNEKALEKWLTENGDLFVKSDPEQSQQDGSTDTSGQQDEQHPDVENTFGAINRIHSASSAALTNKFQAAMPGIPKNATTEEVLEHLKGL